MGVLQVEYDDRRCGYWVKGAGFDFFAYFTGDEPGVEFIECSNVTREGDSRSLHLSIPLGGAKRLTEDVLETAILQRLAEFWDI